MNEAWSGCLRASVPLACFLAAVPAAGIERSPGQDASAHASGASVIAAPKGRTTMAARFGSGRVRVTMLAHQVAIKGDAPPPHPKNACTYSRIPCSLVDRFEIFVDGRSIALPRSAVAHLADIDTMQLSRRRAGRYRLRIDGGDAAESYAVVLVFDGEQVRERIDIWSEGAQVVDRILYRRAGRRLLERTIHYKIAPLE